MTAKPNSLQAVLDRQKIEPDDTPQAPTIAPSGQAEPSRSSRSARKGGARAGSVLIGGHFSPDVSKQLGIIAAEEATTKQDLLAQALDLLFVKKGKKLIRDL